MARSETEWGNTLGAPVPNVAGVQRLEEVGGPTAAPLGRHPTGTTGRVGRISEKAASDRVHGFVA